MSEIEPTLAESSGANRAGVARFLTSPRGALAACGLALVLAVVGLLAPIVFDEMRRQEVIAEVQAVGEVEFDPDPHSRWRMIGPWLPERFRAVRSVALGGTDADARGFDFARLQYLPELTFVMPAYRVDAKQLLALPPLDNLKALVLYLDGAGDDVVRHIANTYPHLEALVINGPTDASIPELCRLKELRLLNLCNSQISTTALCKLTALKHLEKLFLCHLRPTDERARLEKLFNVEWGPERILD